MSMKIDEALTKASIKEVNKLNDDTVSQVHSETIRIIDDKTVSESTPNMDSFSLNKALIAALLFIKSKTEAEKPFNNEAFEEYRTKNGEGYKLLISQTNVKIKKSEDWF